MPLNTGDVDIFIGLELVRTGVYVVAGGLLVGLFYPYPKTVALILSAVLLGQLMRMKFAAPNVNFPILCLATLITLLCGWIVELWGTSNHYWTYHGLADGHQLPSWVPLAWALAYVILYRAESRLMLVIGHRHKYAKYAVVCLVSCLFPVLGEVVAIHLGVWTYTWPYQLVGVPVLAILLLMVLHLGVFFTVQTLVQRRGLSDPLYNPGRT